jgi:hypothetical protein
VSISYAHQGEKVSTAQIIRHENFTLRFAQAGAKAYRASVQSGFINSNSCDGARMKRIEI